MSDDRSPGERLKIGVGSRVGAAAIALIGRTLRWESEGTEHLEAIHDLGQRAIFTFWHGRIFPAIWFFRNRGIVVMTSLNVDGELITRCIERHGFRTARGSSSLGGFRALAEMARELRNRRDVGFTIDGPRGPRYVAKQGSVILARKTGAGILCFHIAMRRSVQFPSWDHFQVPMPFTRARVFMAPPLWVAPNATEDEVRSSQQRVQDTLDGLVERGREWAGHRAPG